MNMYYDVSTISGIQVFSVIKLCYKEIYIAHTSYSDLSTGVQWVSGYPSNCCVKIGRLLVFLQLLCSLCVSGYSFSACVPLDSVLNGCLRVFSSSIVHWLLQAIPPAPVLTSCLLVFSRLCVHCLSPDIPLDSVLNWCLWLFL